MHSKPVFVEQAGTVTGGGLNLSGASCPLAWAVVGFLLIMMIGGGRATSWHLSRKLPKKIKVEGAGAGAGAVRLADAAGVWRLLANFVCGRPRNLPSVLHETETELQAAARAVAVPVSRSGMSALLSLLVTVNIGTVWAYTSLTIFDLPE